MLYGEIALRNNHYYYYYIDFSFISIVMVLLVFFLPREWEKECKRIIFIYVQDVMVTFIHSSYNLICVGKL